MATARVLQDLIACQLSMELCDVIFEITETASAARVCLASDTLAPWHFGTVVLWHHGTVALWHHGTSGDRGCPRITTISATRAARGVRRDPACSPDPDRPMSPARSSAEASYCFGSSPPE